MSTSGIDSSGVSSSLESLKQSTKPEDSDAAIIASLAKNPSSIGSSDAVDVSLKNVYSSLTVLAEKVLDKLQEILGSQLPDGVRALKPEDHTAEKTAQRIVDGTTALLGVFAKQHPDLEGGELITEFMKTIRGGIDSGYRDADAVLGDIGAYDIDGVKSGIDETKRLVEAKLQVFEDNYRKQNGLPAREGANPEAATVEPTKTTVQSTTVPRPINQTA